ncbi:hypothetical protein [Cellulomonas fengjieae]|uniref:hypothetical protein n=1 Tax=Cellulomonas fengjieae TaxID=2819978 RepID=UPI001AAF7315|nr:hypothetical protein [Cellulomonas fengjieae]MBO3100827.1 hypothetical protein [Cellulomonas fengjieae]
MDDRTENGTTDGIPDGTADDTAFARLQAADPAAGATPDVPALYAAVTERTGVPVAAPADELAARRSRRAPRWLQVAAAVAGVAVIGGGGYAYGVNSAPTQAVLPAITLESAAGGRADTAPQAASMAGGAVDTKMMYPWWGGRTVFAASGLSGEGGSGGAWGFDAAGVYSEATAAAAAAALGVPGQPRLEYGTWSVGPNDGSAASVSLSADGLASLSYYDPTRDPWNCVRSAPDRIEEPSTGGADEPSTGTAEEGFAVPETGIVGGPGCSTAAPAPTGDAAIDRAKEALSAVGVDPAGYELAASTDPGSPQVTNVSASQVLDGQLTGVTASVTVVADGVQSLYVPLAPLVELGSYDVVSPTDAVARLDDPRFGASGGGGVMPLAAGGMRTADDAASSSEPQAAVEPTVPATPQAGSPLAWPVQEVTLVSARLGVALTTLPTGASVLVPTYELADADGATWSVIAVVDDQLDFSAVG